MQLMEKAAGIAKKNKYLEVMGEAARMGSSSDEHLVFQTPTLTGGEGGVQAVVQGSGRALFQPARLS